MKIDELIEKYRIMENKGSIMFPQRPDIAEKSNMQYKETADYLEELKAYREQNGISENVYRVGYKFGYNKAIDDFASKLCKRSEACGVPVHCKAEYCEGKCGNCISEIRNVSELLKLGDQNEN